MTFGSPHKTHARMHAEHLYMGKKKKEEFSWFLAQKKKKKHGRENI